MKTRPTHHPASQTRKSCVADHCERPRYYRQNVCRHHYECRRLGLPLQPIRSKGPLPLDERLMRKVARVGDHWLWTGLGRSSGRGTIKMAGRRVYAHRAAYEAWVGPIPDGHHIHHRLPECGISLCINPEHLEAVSPSEHRQRHAESQVKPKGVQACRLLLAFHAAGGFDSNGSARFAVPAKAERPAA